MVSNLNTGIINLNSTLSTNINNLNTRIGNVDDKYSLLMAGGITNNGIYRHKNLGNITSANIDNFISSHQISTGEFKDIYPGDYFTILDGTYNSPWLVAGLDTERNKGNDINLAHHITCIPINVLFEAPMNDTDTTQGGFAGSKMYRETLPIVANNLRKVLGSHLLRRKVLLTNGVDNNIMVGTGTGWYGSATSVDWYESDITLMNEIQLSGARIFSSSGFDIGEGTNKLPLFNFVNSLYYSVNNYFWLSGVANYKDFVLNYTGGDIGSFSASQPLGVKPLITIG